MRGLVQRNFYFRHENKPKATLVLLINIETGEYARGVSVCNDSDNFCKETGRTLALNRAKKELSEQYHSDR